MWSSERTLSFRLGIRFILSSVSLSHHERNHEAKVSNVGKFSADHALPPSIPTSFQCGRAHLGVSPSYHTGTAVKRATCALTVHTL